MGEHRTFLLRHLQNLQESSVRYIDDNRQSVVQANQNTLVGLNVFYFFIVIIYFAASKTVFADWGVGDFYQAAAVLQVPVLLAVLFRYSRRQRQQREVKLVCMAFQLYAMLFAGIMSIVPIQMGQPAVYFAPIGLGFVVAFIFTFYETLALALIETVCYVAASFVFKETSTFVVDACSSGLFFILSIYISRILYRHRTNENEARQRIRRMGMIDFLTSVYNKASTEFLSKGYLKSHPDEDCIMMILDFDNFKYVNDTFGHQTGDVVLKNFGAILKAAAGEENIAGRIGGDEFFLLLKNCDREEGEKVANRILSGTRAIKAPDGSQPFSCSIGAAQKDGAASSSEPELYGALFAQADRALYTVKESGKNNFHFVD